MSSTKARTAITPTREEDFPEWYQQAVKAADLAESSPVRGCMVIKPWGYGIWENIQKQMDRRIKATGTDNAYFPLFIPLSFLEKEAEHVEGFAKECAVVTHHRLEEQEGKLVPAGELEEPLVVRPTSETIIGHSFKNWIHSYRDLPLKINQWANVVRWEMRTRLFLRTAEFLWQEGHTAHATSEEAHEFTKMILFDVYQAFIEEVLAVPLIPGVKSEGERFPGADETYCLEAMMQDRKALQFCTSHYLGQNFSKAQEITFDNEAGELEHAYTTSWGSTTRQIGAMVMVHGDDDGVRLPPRVAPQQIVIIPVTPKEETREAVLAYAEELANELRSLSYHGEPLGVKIDDRDLRGGEKTWQWVKRGIPIRVEVGPRDLDERKTVVCRRDRTPKEKEFLKANELVGSVVGILDEIQQSYFDQAKAMLEENTHTHIENYEQLQEFFSKSGGFVRAKWCEDPASEAKLAEHKLTIRCIPLDQSGTEGTCVVTGQPAKTDVIIAKAY